jgi:hypothetical protein
MDRRRGPRWPVRSPERFNCCETLRTTKRKEPSDMDLRHPHRSAPTVRLRRFGSRPKDPAAWVGQGTAWLVYDAGRDCYHCYWLVGPADDHLIERATEQSAADAVEWARPRTPNARIRLGDHRTYWAGTDRSPPGFAGTWTPANPPPTVRPLPAFLESCPRPTPAQTRSGARTDTHQAWREAEHLASEHPSTPETATDQTSTPAFAAGVARR